MPEIANVASGEIYKTAQAQKGMSLAEMLNISKSAYELSKLKELYPSMIAEQQAKSVTAQTESEKAKRTLEPQVKQTEMKTESESMDLATKKQSLISNGYVSKIYDPMIVAAAKNPNSVNKDELVKNITKWGIQQGKEAGVDQETTMRLIQPYIEIAQNNPGQLQDFLKQRHILGLTAESRTSALTPSGIQVNTGAGGYTAATNPFGGIQQGQAIPGTQFTQKVSPQTITVNGVQGTLDAGGNFQPLGSENVTPNPVTPVKEKPQIIAGETKIFNAGGVPQLNEQQKSNADIAREEKAKYGGMAVEIGELEKSISSAEKTLSSSAASAPGRAIRSGGKWLGGNENLDILTKSLADITNRQAKIMGAGTDAARDASAAASPNVNLTEGGLRSILERTKATNTGFLSFLEANKNYETNRGSDNANVNHTQFKNAWGQNYDTNYFMVKNINRSNMSEAEKQLAKQKLFKNYSEEQLQEYKQKAINLKRLERGDYQ